MSGAPPGAAEGAGPCAVCGEEWTRCPQGAPGEGVPEPDCQRLRVERTWLPDAPDSRARRLSRIAEALGAPAADAGGNHWAGARPEGMDPQETTRAVVRAVRELDAARRATEPGADG